MGRRRGSDPYIEPRTIAVIHEGVKHEGLLFISYVAPNRYQYSVAYGGETLTNSEDLMPDIYLCEVHGKGDLLSMVLAKRDKKKA